MKATSPLIRMPSRPLSVGAAGIAAGAGVLAAINPVAAVLALLAGVFVVLILANLTAGLLVFVGASYLEAIPQLIPTVTLAKAAGLVLVVSWAATATMRRRGVPSLLAARPSLAVWMTLFVVWAGASLLWARESGPVYAELSRFVPLFALFWIMPAAIRERRHAMALALVVIAGAIVSAAAGILSPADAEGAGRLAGSRANALAPVLIVGAVLAAAFAGMTSRPLVERLAAVAAGGFCIVGVVLTGSRGGLVGLVVAVLVGLVFAGRGRRARIVPVVAVAVALTALYVAALAPPAVRDRIAQPGDGSGRADIWRVGAEMVKSNPVLGVGAGNFKARSPEYVLQAGLIRRSDLIVDRPLVTHNIYLQILAQLGSVGLLLFLGIIGASLAAAAAAARAFTRQRDEQMELLSRALFVALCGILAAGFFGSWLFSKPLWILLATCPALLAMARLRPPSQTPYAPGTLRGR